MPLEQFVETDVDNIVELFKVFNDGNARVCSPIQRLTMDCRRAGVGRRRML